MGFRTCKLDIAPSPMLVQMDRMRNAILIWMLIELFTTWAGEGITVEAKADKARIHEVKKHLSKTKRKLGTTAQEIIRAWIP